MKRKIVVLIIVFSTLLSRFSSNVLALQSENLGGGQLLKNSMLENNLIYEDVELAEIQAEDITLAKATYLQSYIDSNPIAKQAYGGRYIDEKGKLHVVFTENVQTVTINDVNTITNGEVVYESGEYTLDELMAIKKHISNTVLGIWEQCGANSIVADLASIGVYEQYNRVVVRLKNCDAEKISEFKKTIIDTDAVLFEDCKGYENQSAIYRAGRTINIPECSSGYSIGFRCRYLSSQGNYYNGFMTAGHGNSTGYYVYFNDICIGYIMKWDCRIGENTDAAFVYVTNSDYAPTNSLFPGLGTLVAGAYARVNTTGQTVYMAGGTSGYSTGRVISLCTDSCDINDRVLTSDCIETDYDCADGDSGGITYIKNSSGAQYVIGMHIGGWYDDDGLIAGGFVTPIDNMKENINFVLY